MASKFTFTRSNPAWDFRVDLDGDGAISILDLSAEAQFSSLPTTCWAQRTNYLYDGLGNLVKRTSTDVSTAPSYTITSTLYIDGIFEKTNGGAVTKYYGAFGRNLAVRSVPTGTGPGTLSYLLADHLGSTVGALDSAANSLGTQAYWPFGAARSQSGTVATADKLYTSQQRESLTAPAQASWYGQGATDALGTYFYHARFYSTVTGRFTSADPVVGNEANPQSWNPYSYVRNNPMRLIDPTGGVPTTPASTDVDSCAKAIAACLMFSAQGDTERYITLVAGYFQLDASMLAAIVLNEYQSLNFRDTFDGSFVPSWVPLIGGKGGNTIGIAQINIDLAMEVARLGGRGFEGLYVDREITQARLLDPHWAVFYAAAVLDYRSQDPAFRAPSERTDADYIVIYRFGPGEQLPGGDSGYRGWIQKGGCDDVCGNQSPAQIAKVRALYPTAIRDLARVVDVRLYNP